MDNPNIFEAEWRKLCVEISQTVYTQQETQKLKYILQTNGFLIDDEKSRFIEICDKYKYEVIEKKFGKHGTEGYKVFSKSGEEWFQKKGVESEHSKGQRDSVEHIMFGSTPDPEKFLLNFEHEALGSIKNPL